MTPFESTFAIFALLAVFAALIFVLWDPLWFAVSDYFDDAAKRLAPARERLARSWANLKFGVVQKARASARLVATLTGVMVTHALWLPAIAMSVVAGLIGYAVSPITWLIMGVFRSLRDFEQQGREDCERLMRKALDKHMRWL